MLFRSKKASWPYVRTAKPSVVACGVRAFETWTEESFTLSPIIPILEPAKGDSLASHALNGDILRALATHSRFVQRIRRRYADQLTSLPPGPPDRESMSMALQALQISYPELADRLRVLRQLVMERLVVLDCEQRDRKSTRLNSSHT